ncbi:ATP12 family protein [Parasaccharibacter sp. TMW2.1890]|uniref:ATP12 family protein n=1 Tax=Parasaccharibacter sp. TMW2.1890 TaxID=2039289 RepID=UPI002013144F|nr:ATP12 family protein [Parasaccharibacter sp. TMW2.1890]
MAQLHRRFWKQVTVGPVGESGQQGPLLDGRPVKLPAGTALAVSSPALAEALAEEWRQIAEGAQFTPDDLVLTRMAGSHIERILPDRAAMEAALHAYGIDDNLCYRSAAQDDAVTARIRAWAAEQGLHPAMTDGLMPLEQPAAYGEALTHYLSQLEPAQLTALGVMVPIMGSLLLPLALVHDVVSFDEAVHLAHADEYRQLEKWGHDRELATLLEKRNTDIADALRFLHLAQGRVKAA